MKKRIAVFLDRDGTVNDEAEYLGDAERLLVLPRAGEAIRLLNEKRIPVVLVTNQSGVARGYFSESTVNEIHERLKTILARDGAHIDGIYYCPHHPEVGLPEYRLDCDCRKPRTGMVKAAEKDLNIDLSGSYMIGDKVIDMELARNAGVKGILVLTGYGREELKRLGNDRKMWPDHVADDLFDAVQWILNEEKKRLG